MERLDNPEPQSAAYYRLTAQRLRQLADSTQFADCKAQLVSIARRFERLAEWVDERVAAY
jgi:hypothetical protein